MEMMRNPNAMREAMRSQDLAMSQLENLPGGFNALRNMFETVQEPMMEAAQQSQQNLNSGSNSNTTTTTAPTAPVNSALPNPWGGAGSATNNPPGASNPFAGLGAMGGMGGFGNMGMGGMGGDPAQAMAMLQNPFMQQMMQQMMQNPAMLDQVTQFLCEYWNNLFLIIILYVIMMGWNVVGSARSHACTGFTKPSNTSHVHQSRLPASHE